MRHGVIPWNPAWCWWWLDDSTVLIHWAPTHELVLIHPDRLPQIIGPTYHECETIS